MRCISHQNQPANVIALALMLLAFCCVTPAQPNPLTPQIAASVDPNGLALPVETQRAIPIEQDQSVLIRTGDEISSIPKKFQYALRLNIRGVYDDDIFLSSNGSVGDFYLAIEPGLTIGYGDIVGRDRNYIQFDYAPSFFVYASHSNANAVQHLMHLVAEYRLGHLTMSLGEDVEIRQGTNPVSASSIGNSNPSPTLNLDAGAGTDVNTYATSANFSYDLTGKTFLSGGLHYSRDDYQSLIGSQMFSGSLFINYTYSPKLVVGLGGTAGYNWVESTSPNQSFEQINATTTYQLSGKVNLNASGGIEIRQFEGNSSGSHVSPVYALSATYQPFDGTTLTLSGNRNIQNSAVLNGQDYSSTTISISGRQRFLRRIYLGLALGYENLSYFSTTTGVNASRDDNYFYAQPAVDITLTRYWTAGVYYLHRENNSSANGFSFSNNQYGFRTSFTF